MDAATITWAPLVPDWILWCAAALTAGTLGFALLRQVRGSVLRLGAAATLLIVLANPSLVLEQRTPKNDVAVVVLDETPSQELGERLDRSRAALRDLKARLSDHENLELREVVVRHHSLEDGKQGTRLLSAAENALAAVPPDQLAGVFLITDGRVHDVPQDPGNGGHRFTSAPVHVLLSGRRDERDRRLEVVKAPAYGLVGERVTLQIRIEDTRTTAERVPVTVEMVGQTPRRVRLPVGRTVPVELPLERRGKTVIALSAEGVPDELSMENNQAVVTVNAVRDRLRVLLVSGIPHAGERTWRNLLKADPSVDLVHFTILRPPEKQDGTPIHELSLIAFPTRELFQNKLDEFDLIVFDRYRRRGVLPGLYLRNILDFVRNGGALLEVAGPGFAGPYSLYQTALGEILPGAPTGAVTESGFKPNLTTLGLRHPVTARLPGGPVVSLKDELRWGRWFRQIEIEPRSGHTLMSGLSGQPLLIVDRFGDGRVAQLASDQIWLWARGFEGGGPYAELIRRLAHWLMKEPELEENDLTAEVEGSHLKVDLRSLLPIDPKVEVESPAGETRLLRLRHKGNGWYRGAINVSDSGLYRVYDGTRQILVPVGAAEGPEMQKIITTPELLTPVADATDGGVFWLVDGMPGVRYLRGDRRYSGADWMGLRRNEDFMVTGLRVVSLLPAWISLIVVFLLVVLAWRREAE